MGLSGVVELVAVFVHQLASEVGSRVAWVEHKVPDANGHDCVACTVVEFFIADNKHWKALFVLVSRRKHVGGHALGLLLFATAVTLTSCVSPVTCDFFMIARSEHNRVVLERAARGGEA